MEYGGILVRLSYACAFYRQRYHEWPTQLRLSSELLLALVGRLTEDEFEYLASRIELRTHVRFGLTVGGRGVIDYATLDHEVVCDVESA